MVQANRRMTTMGIATAAARAAAGIEISSLAHGHHPTKQHVPLPSVSFRGEWGVLQRENRRGATYGRAKFISDKTSWAKAPQLLSSHKRPKFYRAHHPKPKPPHLYNRPIFNTLKLIHDSSSSEV